MHRFAPQISCIGLAAQSALRQPKKTAAGLSKPQGRLI
jgi:hypothetical protein